MAVRKAEVLFVGDAASIVRAAKQAEAASMQAAAAAKKAAGETTTANRVAGDAAIASANKQAVAHRNAALSIASVGTAMSRMTFPILAVAGASAKMAMDFQSSTEKLRTQAGATQVQTEKLRQGILKMAGSLGTSPQQLSAGMYHVVSSMNAVLPPTKRVSGELTILKDAAKLAKVGGANLEETTYALASAMNALHAPISQTTKITGQLNAIVGAGDMTMTDLIDSFQSGVVPAAKLAGLSFQSLGAAMAVMGDMGMRGAIAGTRMRMSIALLSSPSAAAAKVLDTLGMSAKQATSTSAAMAAALEKAGLRTTQLGADLKKPDGFMVALKDLNDHLRASGMTATGAAAVMNKAFGGGKMGATITLLAENTGRLGTKFAQIGDLTNKFGADWKATTETAAFKWHAMLATVQADGIKLGGAVLPIVLGVGKQVVSVVTTVSRAFQSLPKGAQNAIITGGLILATIGPAMKILGVFTSGIGKLYKVAQAIAGLSIFGGAAAGAAAGAGSAAAASGAARAAGTLAAASSVQAAMAGGGAAAAAGGLSVGIMPIAAAAAGAFVGISALSKAINGDGGVNAGLVKMQAGLKGAIAAGNVSAIHTISSQAQELGNKLNDMGVKGGSAYKSLSAAAADAANRITGSMGQLLTSKGAKVAPFFKDMAAQAGKAMGDIELSVKIGSAMIPQVLGKGSQAGRQALAQNFLIAVQDVRGSMASGVVSVSAGIAEINKLLTKALNALGSPVKLSDVKAIGQAGAMSLLGSMQTGATAPMTAGTFAGGGLVQFGRPGDKGHDNIPARMGGKDIVVGSGELGAVFNHTQQKVANSLLAPVGGLPGLFNNFTRPHYMASGGYTGYALPVPRSMMGNTGSWSLDAGVDIPGGAGGQPEYAIGPGVITGEGMSGFGPNAPVLRITAGPLAGRSIFYGHAGPDTVPVGSHVRAGQQISSVGRGIVGMSTGPHIEIGFMPFTPGSGGQMAAVLRQLLGGAGVTGSAGGALGQIKAPGVKGSGTIATIARAALRKVAAAANAYAASHAPSSGLGAAGTSGSPSGHFSGSLASWLTQALQITNHFSPGNLAALEGRTMQESGGNPRSINLWDSNAKAGHPSKGLLQTIDSTFGTYKLPGHGDIWNPVDNAIAAIRYMFARYGHIVGPGGGGYAKGGMLPFAGAFKNGGVVPGQVGAPSMALVHGGEVIHAAKGYLPKNPASGPLAGISLASAQALFPLDAALAELTAKIQRLTDQGAPNHSSDIAKLTDELAKLRRERLNPPVAHNAGQIAALQHDLAGLKSQRNNLPIPAAGKAGDAQRLANAQSRKDLTNQTLAIEAKIKNLKAAESTDVATRRKALANQTLTIEEKIKELKEKDKAAKSGLAETISNLNLQSKNLAQLKAYTDAITTLKGQMRDLASQAAQAWRTVQTNKIAAAHDAAIAAIANGPQSQQLASMQAQDKVDAAERQLDSLNKNLAAAQKLVRTTGGQAHLDALAGLQDAQQALTDFQRQQDEQRLQDQIATATAAADATQATALAGLDQQTADYQQSLDNQLGALTSNLEARKVTYVQWAQAVNAILSQYGLAAPVDAATEQTVATGPGSGGGGGAGRGVKKPAPRFYRGTGGWGGHRASGGPVQPGYVYRVGENGPEDVVFGRSGMVLNASQTQRNGGGPLVHMENVHLHSAQEARAMADRLAFRAHIGTA